MTASSYTGHWEGSERCGYGIHVADKTRYEGDFRHNQRHGLGTLWVRAEGKRWRKTYSGGWSEGRKEGEGVYFYDNGDVYRGEWINGERSGRGSMQYFNGDEYVGSFRFDGRCGSGSTTYSCGDVHEGHYSDDVKEGPGLFFYAGSGKVYEGEWVQDLPRCGQLREPTPVEKERHFASQDAQKGSFKLPPLELLSPSAVLAHSIAEVHMQRSTASLSAHDSFYCISSEAADRGEAKFRELDVDGQGVLPMDLVSSVLIELGVHASPEELRIAEQEVGLREDGVLSFPDLLDLAQLMRTPGESD